MKVCKFPVDQCKFVCSLFYFLNHPEASDIDQLSWEDIRQDYSLPMMGDLTQRIEEKQYNLSQGKLKMATDYIDQCGFDQKQSRIDVGKFSLAARDTLNWLMYLVKIIKNQRTEDKSQK